MSQQNKNRHTLLLLVLAAGMFGFAFALVPLYNVFCEITGLNGKTSAQAALVDEIEAAVMPVDREVTIEFLAKAARGMPWEFRPVKNELVVRPGDMHTVMFYVRNLAHTSVIGQAVPSVSPGQAALHLRKIECFCFERQELPAHGEMEMPVRFYVSAELPAEIGELTLSYTMFNVSDVEATQLVGQHE